METADILKALGNDYNPDILCAAKDPMSAKEFSDYLDVPIATCYRRIEELTDAGLLEHHDRVLTDGQRRTSVYRRKVNIMEIEFNGTSIDIDIQESTPVQNKLDNVWSDLSTT